MHGAVRVGGLIQNISRLSVAYLMQQNTKLSGWNRPVGLSVVTAPQGGGENESV